jgi:hypothetical protein
MYVFVYKKLCENLIKKYCALNFTYVLVLYRIAHFKSYGCLTTILIHEMYLFMCMIIKLGILGIQEQRNMSLVMPCKQGVNLGLREGILHALYIFEFCTLQL